MLRKVLNCSDCPSELLPLSKQEHQSEAQDAVLKTLYHIVSKQRQANKGEDRDFDAKAGTVLKTEKLFEKSIARTNGPRLSPYTRRMAEALT